MQIPRTVLILIAGCAMTAGLLRSAPAATQAKSSLAVDLGNDYAAIVDRIKGSVVSVLSEKVVRFPREVPFPFGDDFLKRFFEGPQGPRNPQESPHQHGIPIAGLGSGFILDAQGRILTNYHVIAGMEKLHVVLADKRKFEAVVVGSDPKTDIAVIRMKGDFPRHLPTARLGNSDTVRAGHIVLAFGAPFGLAQTVTSGIISATGRSDVGVADFEDFIQTDAPINPGNSGGPLVNMNAEVIGLNTAIATSAGQSSGVGFAIPINMVKEILPTLLKGKKVVRGMLGVVVQDLTPALAQEFQVHESKGALVSQVNPGSPAERAGLKSGDVIIGFAGKSVTSSSDLRTKVSKTPPGATAEVAFIRNGKKKTTSATMGELRPEPPRPSAPPSEAPLARFGLNVEPLTPQLAEEFQIRGGKGLVITDVDDTSAAGLAGLQPGDLITEINRKKVDTLQEVRAAIHNSKNPDKILLLVNRRGVALYIALETG